MHVFYTPDIESDYYLLNQEESRHCIKVLRLKLNDEIVLVDGRGGWHNAIIIDPNPKCCEVQILQTVIGFGKSPFHLNVAIAPTKNIDRFEWFLEKATEIGIQEITPIICANSERKTIKEDRLEKILISAMKQSERAYLPVLKPLVSFMPFITAAHKCQKFIAHCEEQEKEHLGSLIAPHGKYLVLIGPEGDFSKEEIQVAHRAGFQSVSLGPNRLRTETAGMVATSIINIVNEMVN